MFKKVFNIIVFVLFVFYSISNTTVIIFASSSLDITDIKINGNANYSNYSLNPGEEFGLSIFGKNNTGIDIKNLFVNFDFKSIDQTNINNYFSYNGTDLRGVINYGTTINPIPSSAYDINNGFSSEITNGSIPLVLNTKTMFLDRVSNSNSGIKISNDIKTYENIINYNFSGKSNIDDSGVIGPINSKTIYVNVNPHITDYYFEKQDGSATTNQIQGSEAESINLVLKVKDYNGCLNISSGEVKADLSNLGLSSNETLSYISCEGDQKTAVFKKNGIKTNASLGEKIFDYTYFIATDIDGNQNNPNDPNTDFDLEDKTSTLNLTVVPASAPQVSFLSLNNDKIGGSERLSYNLSFSGSQAGDYKISINGGGNCDTGTVLKDWSSYSGANSLINETINSSSLAEGNNLIYACIKNSGGNIGSINFNLIKDTTPPTTSFLIISPANVLLNDSSVKFSCNENSIYEVRLGGTGNYDGTFIGSGVALANTEYTTSISNNLLSIGNNTIYGYCKDDATNTSFNTGSINKVRPTVSMSNITSFLDNDIDNEGLDGRDLSVSWEALNDTFDTFESYRIYLLPSNISFTGGLSYVGLLSNKNTTSWTGVQNTKKDSLGNDLASGGSYKVCINIMGKSGNFGQESCSSPAILTSDIVLNAKITSAKFTSNTTLELTTDTTLDTNLSSHSGGLISYVYNQNTINPTGVLSVSGKKINLIIPNLNNIGATGSNIIMQTGALRSQGGGFNKYETFNTINDGQLPTISGFVNNTASIYNNYFSGSIDVLFNFGENMKGAGSTKIVFDRTSGNASPQKIFNITNNSNLTSGNHNETISLSGLLVSGTKYNMKIIGEDLAGNSVNTGSIIVGFDNTGPSKPTLIHRENTSSTTPILTWNASNDDSGNGSGVDKYILKIYNGNSCAGGEIQTLESTTTSKNTNSLTNGTYSWNLSPIDKLGNIGQISNCDSFLVDTTIPTIENLLIKDLNINSTSFTSSGNDLEITANLTNTDLNHIIADLSLLTGNSSHTGVICGSPISGISCSYNLGVVKYSFKTGFAGNIGEASKSITLNVSTPSGVTTISKNISITVDSTPPTIANIISPINQTYGGNSLNISWNGLSDNNLEKVFIAYKKGSGSYVDIYSGSNISPYSLDITNFISGNYQIKITGKDRAGNTSFKESSIFTLDKTKPVIANTVFTSIVNGSYIKGNQVFNITWNAGDITDTGGLAGSPITLEYSTNSGGNWNIIAQNLANNGSYNWNIGNLNSKEVKLRIKAIDTFGNESNYIESSLFTIDSSAPGLNLEIGTPPNGVFINNNGFDIISTLSDNIELKSVFYNFKNTSSNSYWDGNSYSGVNTWVKLKDLTGINYSLNELINPTIINGNTYDFTLKLVDRSGNETLSTTREYIGDNINPTLNITNSSGSYFSGSLNILGTSLDSGAGISSIKISIKKGNNYWNGNSFVGSEQILATQTSNNYTNWNYNFVAHASENDGENYEVIVYAYDKSYKVNNTSSGNINIVLDKTGPVIDSDIFTINTSGIFLGGNDFLITWDKTKIISSGSILKVNPITLEFFNGNNWQLVGNNLENSGSYNFTLPLVDINNARFRITSFDEISNSSNTILSNTFIIDSTPPTINSIETMDLNANGQIDALQVFFFRKYFR
ncbi:hypothetical protein H3C61_01675 [Candidatus Gracilibacteria bacterium]|nr:hypothetical protein [Candidatus Gracilibacteria bacterium]